MADRPFPLHPHEVTGLLDGSVTLLARPMKKQPVFTDDGTVWYPVHRDDLTPHGINSAHHYRSEEEFRANVPADFAPIQPGDILVGKEKFIAEHPFTGDLDYDLTHWNVRYYADDLPKYRDKDKWRSPVTMPAWASRIRVPVLSVRAKRVCEMTEDEAKAWGVIPYKAGQWEDGEPIKTYRTGLAYLWRDLYGTRYPWATAWAWFYEVGGNECIR